MNQVEEKVNQVEEKVEQVEEKVEEKVEQAPEDGRAPAEPQKRPGTPTSVHATGDESNSAAPVGLVLSSINAPAEEDPGTPAAPASEPSSLPVRDAHSRHHFLFWTSWSSFRAAVFLGSSLSSLFRSSTQAVTSWGGGGEEAA